MTVVGSSHPKRRTVTIVIIDIYRPQRVSRHKPDSPTTLLYLYMRSIPALASVEARYAKDRGT